MKNLTEDIEKVLISEEELKKICDRLAKQITEDYAESGRPLMMVCILKGSMPFCADLFCRLPFDVRLEFMKVSSYGAGTNTSGFIQVHLDLKRDVKDCDVLLVEDIIDSGRTLEKLSRMLSDRGAHSVKCCTLLDKPSRRQVNLNADYVGQVIPDAFVVGYGLDFDEKYRNLPFVGILKPSVYQEA